MKERNEKLKSVWKIVAGLILLFILYLFALNGRYLRMDNNLVLDKWKRQVYRVNSLEVPVIIDGADAYKIMNEKKKK